MTQTLTACRTAGCTAPETADHATLHRTSDADLLRAFATLTHRIHEATETTRRSRYAPWARQTEADLRAQRDLVQAEALRRMGGQS